MRSESSAVWPLGRRLDIIQSRFTLTLTSPTGMRAAFSPFHREVVPLRAADLRCPDGKVPMRADA